MERIFWLDRDRGIILWRLEDQSVYETVLADLAGYNDLVVSASHPVVYTIIDLSTVGTLPRDSVARFPEMIGDLPPPADSADVIASSIPVCSYTAS